MKCFTLLKYTRDYLNQTLQAVLFYLYLFLLLLLNYSQLFINHYQQLYVYEQIFY
jgi:hypothetical protein